MKTTIALLSIAFAASCASSSGGFVDDQAQECAYPIEVRAGLENMPGVRQERTDDQVTLIVEVANNGNEEFTVKSIRAEQVADETARYRFDTSFGTFNELIEDGKDHVFRLKLTGRSVGFQEMSRMRGSRDVISLAVSVYLVDGRSFRCEFEVGSPP
jgi:hypothetical protein